MSTITLTNGFRDNNDLLVATDQNDWTTRTNWSTWTSWATNPNDLTVQIDIDSGVNSVKTPLITPFIEGDATVELKLSQTGAFTGEETTINFAVGTVYNYTKAKFYRWTFVITDNATYSLPILLGFRNAFESASLEEYFNDLDLSGLAEDSEGRKIVPTTLVSSVNHVQGTAHQGEAYILEDYVINKQNETDTPGLIRNPQTISGTATLEQDGKFDRAISDVDITFPKVAHPSEFYWGPWTQNWTIDFWFYNTNDYSPSTNYYIGLEEAPGNSTNDVPHFRLSTDLNGDLNNLAFSYNKSFDGGAFSLDIDSAPTIGFGEWTEGWHHVAVSCSNIAWPSIGPQSGTYTLFVDGAVMETEVEGAWYGGTNTPTDYNGLFDTEADFRWNSTTVPVKFDEIRWSLVDRYNATAFTPPVVQYTNDSDTWLLLNADAVPVEDFGDTDYGTDHYIQVQRGGAVVIENKNPLKITVVDYNGDAWDGTVDLMVRGLGAIEMQEDYSVVKS